MSTGLISWAGLTNKTKVNFHCVSIIMITNSKSGKSDLVTPDHRLKKKKRSPALLTPETDVKKMPPSFHPHGPARCSPEVLLPHRVLLSKNHEGIHKTDYHHLAATERWTEWSQKPQLPRAFGSLPTHMHQDFSRKHPESTSASKAGIIF